MVARLSAELMPAFFLLLCFLPDTCRACSPPEGWRPPSLVDKILKADIVLYGMVTNTYDDPNLSYSSVYTVELDVFCILKGDQTSRKINITQGGHVPGHCHGSNFKPNHKYVVLATRRYDSEMSVSEAEINATEKNLNEIRKACGLNSVTRPYGTVSTIVCPTSLPDCQRNPQAFDETDSEEDDEDTNYDSYDNAEAVQAAPKKTKPDETSVAGASSAAAVRTLASFATILAIVIRA